MSQAFIKRGNKVHGPFSESQIKAGLKSGKVSQKDLVSKDRSGPWRPIKIESRSEPAVAKTEDGVLGWLSDAQVKATSQAEDQKSPRKTGYPAGVESERQRNTEKKTPTATPTTQTQTAGDSEGPSKWLVVLAVLVVGGIGLIGTAYVKNHNEKTRRREETMRLMEDAKASSRALKDSTRRMEAAGYELDRVSREIKED